MINNDNISVALYELLEILGSSTRARILQLIAQRPFYLSEISRTLNIGQQAVIRHMRKLEESGLVSSYQQEARQSRIPRNYYVINENTHIRLRLTPNGFTIVEGRKSPSRRAAIEFETRFPEIPRFFEDLQKLSELSETKTKKAFLEKHKTEIQKFIKLLNQYQYSLNDHLEEIDNLLEEIETTTQ